MSQEPLDMPEVDAMPELDAWKDEEKEVSHNVVVFNPEKNRLSVEKVTKKVVIPTLYTRVGNAMPATCAVGEHDWFMEDRHKHIAACHNCPKHRFLRAVFEYIEDGHIYDRDTDTLID